MRLLVRFEHADPSVPLIFHCHLLQHEGRWKMGQALVLGPGQRASFDPATAPDHDHAG